MSMSDMCMSDSSRLISSNETMLSQFSYLYTEKRKIQVYHVVFEDV